MVVKSGGHALIKVNLLNSSSEWLIRFNTKDSFNFSQYTKEALPVAQFWCSEYEMSEQNKYTFFYFLIGQIHFEFWFRALVDVSTSLGHRPHICPKRSQFLKFSSICRTVPSSVTSESSDWHCAVVGSTKCMSDCRRY